MPEQSSTNICKDKHYALPGKKLYLTIITGMVVKEDDGIQVAMCGLRAGAAAACHHQTLSTSCLQMCVLVTKCLYWGVIFSKKRKNFIRNLTKNVIPDIGFIGNKFIVLLPLWTSALGAKGLLVYNPCS